MARLLYGALCLAIGFVIGVLVERLDENPWLVLCGLVLGFVGKGLWDEWRQ